MQTLVSIVAGPVALINSNAPALSMPLALASIVEATAPVRRPLMERQERVTTDPTIVVFKMEEEVCAPQQQP